MVGRAEGGPAAGGAIDRTAVIALYPLWADLVQSSPKLPRQVSEHAR